MTGERAATTVRGGHGRRPRVVVVGAGFAALAAARRLARAPVATLVVDQHDHTVFTPFLYQVATALLAPSSIARSVRNSLRKVENADFRCGHVTGVDFDRKAVEPDRGELGNDFHVLAAASVNDYQVGIQSGRHAAESVERLLAGEEPSAFRYRDLGTMAWLLVHIVRIAGLRTRLVVLVSWISGYLLLDRPVRLIVEPSGEEAG